MSTQLAFVGNLTTDSIIYSDGTRADGLPGGGSLYSALSAAFYRDHNGIVSIAGSAYDKNALAAFSAHGIDLGGVRMAADMPGIIDELVYLDPKGEKKAVRFPPHSSDHDDATPLPGSLPSSYKENCVGYHLAACSLRNCCEWTRELPANAVISADPFIRETEDKHDRFLEMMERVNCFLPSEKELFEICGISSPRDSAAYLPLLRSISTDATEVVCVKLGKRGVLVYVPKEDTAWALPPCPSKIVNVTGCGDSFCGGFLAGYTKDRDPFTSAAMGVVASSFLIEHLLSLDLLSITRQAVKARLDAYLRQVDRVKNRVC